MNSLRRWITLISIVTMIVLMGLAGFTSLSKAQGGGTTTRVSVASDGTEGNEFSYSPSLSADGRYVVFFSDASNLVSDDTNGMRDIFVHDAQTGQTKRVSIASNGIQGDNVSEDPSISADGRFVAFGSSASNLVDNDTNGVSDVFVYDQQTGQTSRVSIASAGTQSNSLSYISHNSSISADGRYVVFYSEASNLVANDTNGVGDIFLRDRQTGQTSRVSVASNGTQGEDFSAISSLSANGRYVVFTSGASNLIDNDTNGKNDVFVHDHQTGQTSRVSVASDGTQGNDQSIAAGISADGRYVAFYSHASNLASDDTNGTTDVFVHDRQRAQTIRVSVASDGTQSNSYSDTTYLSANGRYIAFNSNASNLVAGDTNYERDIFVHDRQTRQTRRVSVASNGTQGNRASSNASMSADGRYLAFDSGASNLVNNDTNAEFDVFLREWGVPDYTIYAPNTFYNYVNSSCSNRDSEPNNRFSEAIANLLLCPNSQLTGTATRANDTIDIFRIHVEQAGLIQIDLTNLPPMSDYDLYLYNATFGQEAVRNNPGSQNEQIRFNATQGYYFISVVPIVDDPNSATYQLRWGAE